MMFQRPEPSNPNNRVAFIPKNVLALAYTGPVSGDVKAFAAMIGADAVVYDTSDEADRACDKANAERFL